MLQYLKDQNANKAKQTPHLPWHENLRNGCFMASALLVHVIPKAKLIIGVFDFWGQLARHAWVEIDGNIIDLTATQFNANGKEYPHIYIISKEEAYNNKLYYPIHINGDLKYIFKQLKECGAPDSFNEFFFNEMKEKLQPNL